VPPTRLAINGEIRAAANIASGIITLNVKGLKLAGNGRAAKLMKDIASFPGSSRALRDDRDTMYVSTSYTVVAIARLPGAEKMEIRSARVSMTAAPMVRLVHRGVACVERQRDGNCASDEFALRLIELGCATGQPVLELRR